MFRVFRQTPLQPPQPQRGDGMWRPLAYGIDVLAIVAGIAAISGLLVVALALVPLIVRH